jgi:hypothetical protein
VAKNKIRKDSGAIRVPGYKIRYLKSFFEKNKITDWGAIHKREARHFGIKYPYSRTIVIMQRDMTPKQRIKTKVVLGVELRLMDKDHMSYTKAHRIANGVERRIEKNLK